MYAGFYGTENQRDQRDWQNNVTIVHGQDTVRCFWVTADATIDGFTIAHGHTAWGGGGMYNESCSTLVANCTFLDNSATGIRDIADNPLRGNRIDKTVRFTIAVGCVDYGDAPDPSYPTLALNNGAHHFIVPNIFLGNNGIYSIDGDR